MTPEQKDLFEYSLDQAISIVAENECERLRVADRDGYHTQVYRALDELRKLQTGTEPSYDDWVTVFYITWYQPRQINLAYQILQYFFSGEEKLHIVDYGCGALALNFALAAFMVDNRNCEVYVHGIDSSNQMTEIGQEVWRQFVREADGFPELRDACEALTRNMQVFSSIDKVRDGSISSADNVWLSVMHAIYRTNRNTVKEDLDKIRGRFRPATIIVTGYQGNRDHILHVTGGALEDMSFITHDFHQNRESVFNWERFDPGFMEMTLEWRLSLRDEFRDRLSEDERGMVLRYLQRGLDRDPHSYMIFGTPRDQG